VLENYKQISKIMTSQFNRSFDADFKYKNRTAATDEERADDPDYQRYEEEKMNTLKMATILKELNSP
jgi:hypothetical protein